MADSLLTPAERAWFEADVDRLDRAEHHTCDGNPECLDCFMRLISRSSIGAGIRELAASITGEEIEARLAEVQRRREGRR